MPVKPIKYSFWKINTWKHNIILNLASLNIININYIKHLLGINMKHKS